MQAAPYWSDLTNLQHLLLPESEALHKAGSLQQSSEHGEQASNANSRQTQSESPRKSSGDLGTSTRSQRKVAGEKKHNLGPQNKSSAAQKRYRERQKDKMEVYKQQVAELSKKLQSLQTENETLEERNRLLEKVVQLKDRKAHPAESNDQEADKSKSFFVNTRTDLAAADYFNTVRRTEKPVTLQEASKISPEDLRQVRLDYIKELAKLLLAINDGKNTEAMRQLEDYVLSVRLTSINLIQSMSVRSFAQLLSMKKRICQTSFVSERIMAALNLSWDQKRDYVKARQALLARNEAIRDKRRELVSRIEQAIPGAAPLMSGQKATMLNACESSDRFKASLEEEHRSMGQFHIDCVQVLTPLQEARMLIEAHPGSPDHWLISGYLEAEQKGMLNAWLQEHLGKSEQLIANLPLSRPGVAQNPAQFRIVAEPDDPAEADTFAEPLNLNPQLLPCQQVADPLMHPDGVAPSDGAKWTPPLSIERNSFTSKDTSDSDQTFFLGCDRLPPQNLPPQSLQEQSAMYRQCPPDYEQSSQAYNGFMDPYAMGPVISLNQVDSSSAMQNSQAGLQNLLEAPSLDIMDNLPDIQEDEMWLDLFPGLLTQN